MFCISGSIWGAPLLLLKAVSCLRGPGSLAEARSCFAVTGAGVPVHCAGRGSQTARPVGAEPLDWPSYTQVHKKENMLALMSGSPRLGTGYSLRSGPRIFWLPLCYSAPWRPFPCGARDGQLPAPHCPTSCDSAQPTSPAAGMVVQGRRAAP